MSTTTLETAPAREATRQVTRRELFTRAADLLEEFGWCQRHAVVDETGRWLPDVMSPDADRFCLWGAIGRAGAELGVFNFPWMEVGKSAAWRTLIEDPTIKPPLWNDHAVRTKGEIVQHLRDLAAQPNGNDPLPRSSM